MRMTCNLREFKEFIDNEMIVILGQMDSPTEIFDHVFLVGRPAAFDRHMTRTRALKTVRSCYKFVLLLELFSI